MARALETELDFEAVWASGSGGFEEVKSWTKKVNEGGWVPGSFGAEKMLVVTLQAIRGL